MAIETSFPNQVDTLVEMPYTQNMLSENLVKADHVNLLINAITPVEQRARNVILTDLHALSGTTVTRRTAILDQVEHENIHSNINGNYVSYSVAGTGDWVSFTVEGNIISHDNSIIAAWNNTSYAIIILGQVDYQRALEGGGYQEATLQVEGQVVNISSDGKTAAIAFSLPTNSTNLKYTIICIDKASTTGVILSPYAVNLIPEQIVQSYMDSQLWHATTGQLNPIGPLCGLPLENHCDWPFYPVYYVAETYAQRAYSIPAYVTHMRTTPTYVHEDPIASHSGITGIKVGPGILRSCNSWLPAAANVSASGDFGFMWPDFGHVASWLVDLRTQPNSGSERDYELSFWYKVFYEGFWKPNNIPTYPRIYMHGYTHTDIVSSMYVSSIETDPQTGFYTTTKGLSATWTLTNGDDYWIELPPLLHVYTTYGSWRQFKTTVNVPADLTYVRLTIGSFYKTTTDFIMYDRPLEYEDDSEWTWVHKNVPQLWLDDIILRESEV